MPVCRKCRNWTRTKIWQILVYPKEHSIASHYAALVTTVTTGHVTSNVSIIMEEGAVDIVSVHSTTSATKENFLNQLAQLGRLAERFNFASGSDSAGARQHREIRHLGRARLRRFLARNVITHEHGPDSSLLNIGDLEELARHVDIRDPPECLDRTYLLDSAAHHPTPLMRPFPKPLTTTPAKSESHLTTHQGILSLKTTPTQTLKLPALYYPSLRQNLLSARDIARHYGPVLLLPSCGFIIGNKRKNQGILGIAPWKNGGCQLELTARAARVAPYGKGKPKIKQHSTPLPTPMSKAGQSAAAFRPADNYLVSRRYQSADKQQPSFRLPDSTPRSNPPSATAAAFHKWHLIFNHIRPVTLQKMA